MSFHVMHPYHVSIPVFQFNLNTFSCDSQAFERFDVGVRARQGALSQGRLLLEEATRWQDDTRRPHETQGAGSGVHLWLLCALGYIAHVS